jgi:hypothetical protein
VGVGIYYRRHNAVSDSVVLSGLIYELSAVSYELIF